MLDERAGHGPYEYVCVCVRLMWCVRVRQPENIIQKATAAPARINIHHTACHNGKKARKKLNERKKKTATLQMVTNRNVHKHMRRH